MKIELWSDFGCPFCYVGKIRFENALNKFAHKDKVEVIFKAYLLNPRAPKVMTEDATSSFAKSHNTTIEGAKKKFKMFTDYAQTVGLTYRFDIIQLTNTYDAHRVAKYANTLGLEPAITNRLMKAYFTEGRNLSDFDTLISLSEEVGLDPKIVREVLNSNKYADVVDKQISEGRQVGVQGVPFFVLNRKYGISGAQQEEYFTQVLEQVWEETKELEEIDGSETGPVCNDESCDI